MIEEYRDDVVCGFIRKLCGIAPIDRGSTNETRRAQEILEKTLGIVGIERRKEMYEMLVQCWYRMAFPHPHKGWHTNGDKLLEQLEKLLGGCGRDVHVNHCCSLGLVYQKNRNIRGEAQGPACEEVEERD